MDAGRHSIPATRIAIGQAPCKSIGGHAVVALRTGGKPVAPSADDVVENRGHDLGRRLPAFANRLADQKQVEAGFLNLSPQPSQSGKRSSPLLRGIFVPAPAQRCRCWRCRNDWASSRRSR